MIKRDKANKYGITYLKCKLNCIRNREHKILAFWKFSIGTKLSWSVNGKRKYRKSIKNCARICNSQLIFCKMGTFQILYSCGCLSITPSFSNHSITYSRLLWIVLWTFPSLLISTSLIPKALKDSHNFCLHFKFWSFFIQLKIEKIIGYY